MFLNELKNFSKENWWVYLLLFIASVVVIVTWKWNIVEILILFLLNLMWNVWVMAAIGNYSEKKNKTWAIFHLTSTLLFTSLAIYSFFKFNQAQYLLWQISFLAAATKAITFYNFEKDLKFLNPYVIWTLNLVFLVLFISFWKNFGFDTWISSILMALWFSFVTTGLVSVVDKFRYFWNYIWAFFIISWASIWTYLSYKAGNINWVDLGYFILTLTAFIYFSKLLPKYVRENKSKRD